MICQSPLRDDPNEWVPRALVEVLNVAVECRSRSGNIGIGHFRDLVLDNSHFSSSYWEEIMHKGYSLDIGKCLPCLGNYKGYKGGATSYAYKLLS